MLSRYWKRLHSRKRECIDDQRVSPPHCKYPDSNHITLGDGKSGGEDDESALHLLASFDAERTNRDHYSCDFFLTEGLTGLAEAEGERSSDLRTTFVVADQSAFQADFNEGFEVEFQENVFAADRREEQLACEGPPPVYHSPSKKGAAHDNNEIIFPESLTIQDNSIPHSHSSESTATHTTGSSPFKLLAERVKDIESPRSKNETSRVGSWPKSGSKICSTIITASHYFHLCSRSLLFTSKRSDPIHYQNMDDRQKLEIQQHQALSSHEAASIPTNEISSQPKQQKWTRKMSLRQTTKKHASNDILRLNSLQDIVAKSEESSNFKGIIGIPERKLEDMPLWSAERFLRFQSQEKMMGNKEKGNMHCHEVEKIDALSTQTEGDSSPTKIKSINKSTIREEDWWEITIIEVTDGEIKLDHESGDNATYDDDDDDDGEDNGSNISSHLPLCAMQSTHSSSSSQSSMYDPPDETVECINADVNVDSNTATTAAATVSPSSQTCEEENMSKRLRRASKGMKRTTIMNKSFRNVGLFTWDACRAEWRNYCKQKRENKVYPGCSPSVVSQPPDEVLQPFDHSENNDNAESMTNDSPVPAITSGKNVSDSSGSSTIPRGISCRGKKSSLTSHQYKQVVKGLTGVTRQYELPKAMSLADIVEVYLDIWEGDSV